MSSSKKLTCAWTLRQVIICPSEAQNPIPPFTLYCTVQYMCKIVYRVYLFRQGRGESEPERLEGQQFTKLGGKYQHDWLYLQSINSVKNLPLSHFTCLFFLMTTFCFGPSIRVFLCTNKSNCICWKTNYISSSDKQYRAWIFKHSMGG